LEVDFLVPAGPRRLALIEAKASRTVYPEAARGLLALAGSIGRRETECMVVHAIAKDDPGTRALVKGARAMSVGEMLDALQA
jgi:hypothetical protein